MRDIHTYMPMMWRAVPLACGLHPLVAHAQLVAPQRLTTVSFTSSFESDSNILRLTAQDLALSPSLSTAHTADLTWTPALSLTFQRPFGRESLYVSAQASTTLHQYNHQLDTAALRLQSGLDWRIGSACQSRIGGEYNRQQTEYNDLLTASLTPTVQMSTTYLARLECDRGHGLHPTLSYRHESLRNLNASLIQNNSITDSFDGSLGYKTHLFGQIALTASQQYVRYPYHAPASAGGVHFYTLGVNFSRKIFTHLSGSIAFGYNVVAPMQAGVPRYKGANWSAGISWTPGPRLAVTANIARATKQSNLLNISYELDTTRSISATYALTHLIKLSLSGQDVQRSLRSGPLVGPNPLGAGDRSTVWRAGLAYTPPVRIMHHPVTLALNVSQEQRIADNPALNYRNTSATLSLTMGV